jgi:hypothetical protein
MGSEGRYSHPPDYDPTTLFLGLPGEYPKDRSPMSR